MTLLSSQYRHLGVQLVSLCAQWVDPDIRLILLCAQAGGSEVQVIQASSAPFEREAQERHLS